MPRVYVVNRSGHDFSAALQFGGPLIFLTEGEVDRMKVNKIYREVCSKLEGSCADDYLLQTSYAVVNMIASAVFARKHGRLNLLIYKASKNGEGRYLARQVLLDELLTCGIGERNGN